MITRTYFFVSTHNGSKRKTTGVVSSESFWPAPDEVFEKLIEEMKKKWPDGQFSIDVFNRLS